MIYIDDGPFSIFEDGHFADESFSRKHKEPGLLGMSKETGYAGSNECQFYITTAAPLSYMDNKNVIFGRIINGMRSVNII
jgi:cyclophilin family peptidyl-prolyl cis-trans isomerase